MEKNVVISRGKYSNWIKSLSEDSLMLTISEPHAKTKHLNLTVKDMEPILSKIIGMANSATFGKYKHFEFLRGLIVCENVDKQPHFHIVLNRPKNIEFDKFNKRITKVANKLCDKDFKFDLSESYLPSKTRYFLSTPCYEGFAKTTVAHEGLGKYLTEEYAFYYVLEDRKVNFQKSRIPVYLDFYN